MGARYRRRDRVRPPHPRDFRYIMYHISFSDIIHLIYVFILSFDHGSWIIYSLPKKAPLPRPKSHSRAMVSLLSFMICLVRSFTEIIPIH